MADTKVLSRVDMMDFLLVEWRGHHLAVLWAVVLEIQ